MRTAAPRRNAHYNVSGLVVHTQPAQAATVATRLASIPGVDVHAVGGAGRLVLTVEEFPGELTMMDAIAEINNTPGVINAALVYCESDCGDQADAQFQWEELQ